ncbi:MAG TPA: hypothetical protein VJQ06_03860 [Rhizomicrobium sp.]|nr:hypothetical protein [Rhizomicrobium sp.]
MSDDPRYDGKPLLRLLELYILKALDELPAMEQATLTRLAPKLQAIYGGNGQWHEAIEAAVHMPKDMPQLIRDMWAKNLEIAQANNVPALSAQKFAEMFVDENLVT